MALAALLILSPNMNQAALAQQQPVVPDAPTPQPRPALTGLDGSPITPGKGAGTESTATTSTSGTAEQEQTAPSSRAPSTQGKDEVQTTPPEMPAPGEGMTKLTNFVVDVNFVEVPV